MTDRIKGVTVMFELDVREDDVTAFIEAVRLFRNVSEVRPVLTVSDDHWARQRARSELRDRIYKVLEDE